MHLSTNMNYSIIFINHILIRFVFGSLEAHTHTQMAPSIHRIRASFDPNKQPMPPYPAPHHQTRKPFWFITDHNGEFYFVPEMVDMWVWVMCVRRVDTTTLTTVYTVIFFCVVNTSIWAARSHVRYAVVNDIELNCGKMIQHESKRGVRGKRNGNETAIMTTANRLRAFISIHSFAIICIIRAVSASQLADCCRQESREGKMIEL